jgi:urease subunit beta
VIPGEIVTGPGAVPLNPGADRVTLTIVNAGDRPVQVGSHYHLAAANPALVFDRRQAWGRRLDIPAGTAVRFEPGVHRTVDCVPIRGARLVPGLRGELAGPLDRAELPAGLPGTPSGDGETGAR